MPLGKKVVVEWDSADEVVNNFNSYQANNPVFWGTLGYPRVLNNNFNSHQTNNPVLWGTWSLSKMYPCQGRKKCQILSLTMVLFLWIQ